MAMVCAQCNEVYDRSERLCPVCGIQLLVHRGPTQTDDSVLAPRPMSKQWQNSAWGRVVISLVLVQGLAFCLQQAGNALFLASGGETAESWNTPFGIITLHSFHLLALLLGGMLAGANQERGVINGAILGLWNGLIFLGFHRASREWMPLWLFFSQPLLHLAFGLVGGVLGFRIWRPITVYAVDEEAAELKPAKGTPRPAARRLMRGPVHTVRVCVGAAIVIGGVLFSKQLMDLLIQQFPGTIRIQTYLQENLVRYEIAALATFVGAAFAGANASNGFKQGLCCGILAGCLYLGTQLADPKSRLEPMVLTAGAIVAVCLIGGAFGSALFPPLASRPTKKAIPY